MVCNIEHKMWLEWRVQAMGLDLSQTNSYGGDIECATWNWKNIQSNNATIFFLPLGYSEIYHIQKLWVPRKIVWRLPINSELVKQKIDWTIFPRFFPSFLKILKCLNQCFSHQWIRKESHYPLGKEGKSAKRWRYFISR